MDYLRKSVAPIRSCSGVQAEGSALTLLPIALLVLEGVASHSRRFGGVATLFILLLLGSK